MMLDNFQRITVEVIRRHKGGIAIQLDNEDGTTISPAHPDRQLNKDIAIALQGYYNRQNQAKED